ncbi:MAG TPA: hypothetical protein ENK57_26005, partial [Polyangiaceae bacterium]|nr:hypothetical protein [Polyangiaceae bacterium]
GHAIGTPAYMSPEQARGDIHQIDERSDVWGLGAMLFELLTGRPPHTGDKAIDVLHKVLDERPPRVLDVQPDAPRELAAIADRALLRDPSSRYPGAEALAAEIRAYQAGTQVHAYDYSGFETLRRFVSRHRAASVAVVSISLAILAATLVSYWRYSAERDAGLITESRRQQAVERRDEAEAEVLQMRQAFASALLDRAEASLRASDPAAASIYAAGALVYDPDNPASPVYDPESRDPARLGRDRQRVSRAFSLSLDAEDARRFVFVRRVAGSSSDGSLSPSGRRIVFPAGRRLIVEEVGSGERRSLDVRAQRVLTFVGEDRVVLSGAAAGVYALDDGARLHELPAESFSAATLELPDSTRLAVVLDDGTAIVLDGETYDELGRVQTAAAEAAGVAWTTPETLMLGGHGLSAVELWDWPAARMRWVVHLPAAAHVIAGSESGAWAALGQVDPLVSVFGPPSEQASHRIVTSGEVSGLAWLRDGLLAAAEGLDRVVIRNVERDTVTDTLHVPSSTEQRVVSAGGVLAVLPARDSAHVVAGSLFRFERHRQRRSRPLPTSVNDVCVDTRRRRILAATLRTIESFPTTTRGLGERETLVTLPPETGHPRRMAVARDGAVAVVTDLGALLLVQNGVVETLIEPSGRVRCALGLAFGRRGDRIFVGSADGSVRRWWRSRGRLGAPVLGHEGAVCGLSIAPSGLAIASSSVDGTLRIWDAGSGALERTVERDDALSDVAFAPDGERLALADGRGLVSIVRRGDGGNDAQFQAHEGWIERVQWSPDGLSLVTAGADHMIRYGSADGERITRILRTKGPPRSVAVSPRGNYLYFHDGRTVVRLGASPAVDSRDPEALLRVAERRAGLRLRGLELVPTP